jgi:hypothetical protein
MLLLRRALKTTSRRTCLKRVWGGWYSIVFALVLSGVAMPNGAAAANWYVRPTAQGSANGTDWNNAWTLAAINWSSVNPGDTVWLAGGSYGSSFTLGDKGNANSRIYIKRATAGDAAATGAAGWSIGFDSQVLVYSGDATVLSWWQPADPEHGSWLHIDGRTDKGIKLQMANGGGSYSAALFIGYNSAIHDTIFTNIDFSGPDDGTTDNFAHTANNAALTIRAGNGLPTVYNVISNLTFGSCRFHGTANIISMGMGLNITWDKCKFYDNVALGCDPAIVHQNMFEIISSGYLTFKNCEMWNWAVEGFMPYGGSMGPITIVGCVFRDPYVYPSTGSSVARFWEVYTPYTIYAYNNTFVNLKSIGIWHQRGNDPQYQWGAGSVARNNLYYNSFYGDLPPPEDYAWSSATANGAHSINNGANPFVNYAGKDFRLTSTIGASSPRNKGLDLGSAYATDQYGVTRGADGSWDIGACEYGDVTGSTNPAIAVSPPSRNFGSIAVGSATNLTFTVQNVGGGTLTGTVAAVAAPFSITSGGGYSLSSNQTQLVTVRYAPTSAGTHSQSLTFSGGGGTTAGVAGSAWALLPAASFAAAAGTIANPFVADAGGFISQTIETGVTSGGRAAYVFMVTNAGTYRIDALANAPDGSANSFYINIDSEPTDPTMIWDLPIAAGFTNRTVSWRGNGTDTSNQFAPKTFDLSAGVHQLIVRGREANAQLAQFSVIKTPVGPTNLFAYPLQ